MFGCLLGCEIGKVSQRVAPHGIDVGSQFGQAFGIETKVMPSSAPLFFDQTHRLQHLKMLRDSRPADRQAIGNLSDRRGLAPQQVENGLTGWI